MAVFPVKQIVTVLVVALINHNNFSRRAAPLFSFPIPIHPSPTVPLSSSRFVISPHMSHNRFSSTPSNVQVIFQQCLESVQRSTHKRIILSTHSQTSSKPAIRLAAFSPCFKSKSRRSSISLSAAVRNVGPNRERSSCLFRDTRRRCQLGML